MKSSLKFALFAALTFGVACNSVPIGTLSDSFSVNVTLADKDNAAVKVDFLWVIDDSASMCQEQASLAQSFNEFITRITSFVNIDFRIAVVTTDMLSADKVARFRHHKTTEFPFACTQSQIQACVQPDVLAEAPEALTTLCENDDCSCANLGGSWVCDGESDPNHILNCNISSGKRTLNSRCKLTCTDHWQCDEALVSAEQGQACGDDESKCVYKCLSPSGSAANSGCVLRPETSQCLDDGTLRQALIDGASRVCNNGDDCDDNNPCADGSACDKPLFPYLTPKTAADYFKCVGVVGAEQHNDANLEQGLNAAIWALNQGGPNSDQARTFIRDDAYLVVVFVSDEDDCSVSDCGIGEKGHWQCGDSLAKERYGTCTCLNDASEGGQLRPVSEAVNMIKALKNDPGRVLVAAIVGDSQGADQSMVELERDQYMNSKCHNSKDNNHGYQCLDPAYHHPKLFNTYMCESSAGKADLGKRYIEFVSAFGANGILTNICSDEGVGPALSQIADRIIRVFKKVCLPRRVDDDGTLVVKLVGPTGTCGDGSACCTVASNQCTDPTTCGDESECTPTETPIEYSEVQDTQTYRLEVTSDCPAEADNKAIVFNSLLPPGTDLLIDYEAVTSLQVSE